MVYAYNIGWDIDIDDAVGQLMLMSVQDAAKALNIPVSKFSELSPTERESVAADKFRHCPGLMEDVCDLPAQVEIPENIEDDTEAITEYLSDKYGYCISGYKLSTDDPDFDDSVPDYLEQSDFAHDDDFSNMSSSDML